MGINGQQRMDDLLYHRNEIRVWRIENGIRIITTPPDIWTRFGLGFFVLILSALFITAATIVIVGLTIAIEEPWPVLFVVAVFLLGASGMAWVMSHIIPDFFVRTITVTRQDDRIVMLLSSRVWRRRIQGCAKSVKIRAILWTNQNADNHNFGVRLVVGNKRAIIVPNGSSGMKRSRCQSEARAVSQAICESLQLDDPEVIDKTFSVND